MMARGLFRYGMTAAVVGAGLLAVAAAPSRPRERDAPVQPVVVELFTAQGCAGCPDANRTVETVAEDPGVIVLTYGVDYWDYLGWSDTFARPEFAERQRAYRQALRLRNVSTPQVVIDGRRHVSGARSPELKAAVEAEAQGRGWPPEIEFRETGDRVGIGSGRPPRGGAEVVAVVYRPGQQTVEVKGGDNRGRAVTHVNVVREVRRLGDWNGRPVLFPLPQDAGVDEGVVVLLQAKDDRRILSSAARPETGRD
ncbi:hypothetical protein that often co-occurs with aconitase [Brevundimonas diminuta 3F5N]|uniref:DUF1223 domain-containing protein n=1 Tax=Brevundimonas diminuta 3F5N TaxID=1255603 RepID=A0A1R4GIB1_BREDI|nr:DUF1223 domain-containing protein [Brevundimonas diminuta]SJM67889.1 hypothetical protein that often co-occurs with aconitase [Brevundimonas diminuta 3F5N]